MKKIAVLIGIIVFAVQVVWAANPASPTERKIGINIASHTLILYEGNEKIRMYPVALGSISTPTPVGSYKVQYKEENPTWIDPSDLDRKIPSGPDNPLGYRWIGFHGTYGIHGTNNPSSIGTYVSNGCVRMYENDVEELYPLVQKGTPVAVYYDRIVINSDADHTVSYYIYPDTYNWQSLTVEQVKKALAGYGVENFEETPSIAEKIIASDGQPTFIAKAYNIILLGKKLTQRALQKSDVMYLPVVPLATELNMGAVWNNQDKTVTSAYGKVPGIVKSDVVYVNAMDAAVLFHLTGKLDSDLQYYLAPLQSDVSASVAKTEGMETKVQNSTSTDVKAATDTSIVANDTATSKVVENKEITNKDVANEIIEKKKAKNKTVENKKADSKTETSKLLADDSKK